MVVKIAVVGAGAVGLSTAVNIQMRFPDADVTVIAEKFDNDTTSAGAGGLSRPTVEHMEGEDEERVMRWFKNAFKEFDRLSKLEDAGVNGVYPVTGYQLSPKPMNPLYKDIVYNFRELTPNELQSMAPLNNNQPYGYLVTTLVTEGRRYQNYLSKRFEANGGKFLCHRVSSMAELAGKYDVVANCCALGARELVGDLKVYPRRGQIVKVHAPWVKQFIYASDDTFIFPLYVLGNSTKGVIDPGIDYVALGTVSQKDNYSLEVNMEDANGILERCRKVVPSLKNAQVLGHWVGLRPHREPVRLEKEVMAFGSQTLKVVHNYGHGRYGVCLSWGTAMEAAQKVAEFLNEAPSAAKL